MRKKKMVKTINNRKTVNVDIPFITDARLLKMPVCMKQPPLHQKEPSGPSSPIWQILFIISIFSTSKNGPSQTFWHKASCLPMSIAVEDEHETRLVLKSSELAQERPRLLSKRLNCVFLQ